MVGGAVVAAIAAGLATGPFTAFHFGSVATLGVVANLVVVPLVGWLGLLLALAGALLLPLTVAGAEALFVAAGWCIVPANAVVTRLAASPWCALDLALASPLDVACACALVAAISVPAGSPRRIVIALGCALVGVRAVKGETIARRGWFEARPFVEPYYQPASDEVIRVQNDPRHPDRGTVTIRWEGGA